jgi:hypothetical protein
MGLYVPSTGHNEPIPIPRITEFAQLSSNVGDAPKLLWISIPPRRGALDLERAVAEFGRYGIPLDADDYALARAALDGVKQVVAEGQAGGNSQSLPQFLEGRQRALLAEIETYMRRASEVKAQLGWVVGRLNDASFNDSTGLLDPWGATKAGFPIHAPKPERGSTQ